MKIPNPRAILSIVLLLGIFALAACQSIMPPPPTPFGDDIYTQAAETVRAGLTQNASMLTPSPTSSSTPTATQTRVPTETPQPTETPEPTATLPPSATFTLGPPTPVTGSVVFEDDFSSLTGWAVRTTDNWGFNFTSSGYRMRVNADDTIIWSTRSKEYADVIVEAVGRQTGGPDSGYYGVICRFVNGNNYYAFVISSDGSYSIIRVQNAERLFLDGGSAPAGVINPSGENNQIQAECLGDTLALFANGRQLTRIQDDAFASGEVGLASGTRQQTGLEAVFERFTVLRP